MLEVTTSYLHGKYGVEIRIWSLREDNTHSWVTISHGSNKFVMDSNNNDTEDPEDLLEEQALQLKVKDFASLTGASGEAVDASSLAVRQRFSLGAQKEEQEEARRKVKEAEAKMQVINRRVSDGTATPAEEAAWRCWIGIEQSFSSTSTAQRRKRKKKRRKRTRRRP